MTEIRVYEQVGNVEWFAERLLREKIVPSGQRAVVMLPTSRSASDFDRMLWKATPEAFVPHVMAEHRLAAETPVVLASAGGSAPALADILVNCCSELPQDFASYPHLVDLVAGAADEDDSARARIEEYSQRGHPLKRFDMRRAG